MLGPQQRFSSSKRLQELDGRAKRLSKEVGYVAEMNRLCSQMVHCTENMLKMMDQNTSSDRTFGENIAQMDGALHAKIQQCDAWLIENTPKLKKMTDQLAEGK